MAEPATNEVPQKPRSRFTNQMEASDAKRRENDVEDLTEEEAEALAVAEVEKVRQERRERALRNND